MNDNDLIRNRLIAYIDRRKQAGGIDYEHIHSFDIGSSTQVDLLTSDIEALILERAARVPEPDAELFDRADWYWRELDPDDCGDTPSEAIHSGMIGDFCVCKIASSFTGPVRYGFNAPVLDPESNDNEFLHFRTEQEAIDAAKERQAALRAIVEAGK